VIVLHTNMEGMVWVLQVINTAVEHGRTRLLQLFHPLLWQT